MRFKLYGEPDYVPMPASDNPKAKFINLDPHWFDDKGLPTGLHDKMSHFLDTDEVNHFGVRVGTDDMVYRFEVVCEKNRAFRATFDLSKGRRIVMKPGMIEIVSTKSGRVKERFLQVMEDYASKERWVQSAVVREVDQLSDDQYPALQVRAKEYIQTLGMYIHEALEIEAPYNGFGLLGVWGPPPNSRAVTNRGSFAVIKLARVFIEAAEVFGEIDSLTEQDRVRVFRLLAMVCMIILNDYKNTERPLKESHIPVVKMDESDLRNLEWILKKPLSLKLQDLGILQELSPECRSYFSCHNP